MSTRKPIIAGNWKMHLTHLDAIQFVQKLSYLVDRATTDQVDVVICPPFTALRSVQTTIQSDKLAFGLGAQNVFPEKEGAFTGEISPLMLSKLDVEYCIVGHSERRQLLGESNEFVNAKAKALIKAGITPIVCVGETLEQREANETEEWIRSQVFQSLDGIKKSDLANAVVAYEPIWAIGTGRTATPDDANSVCAYVRSVVAELTDQPTASALRIQYGGSVKPGNIVELLRQPHIDGALVGGASLDPEEFAKIVRYPFV